ncbi:hypothetical protein GF351_00685 [Candidatus Woesearchaeota archaeon]|nr:hypothetical protein [Candidatus Woesearchaeota archaeon]
MATLEKIRTELQYCRRPLIFFHDDPDGLCSFLLLYRMIAEGKGVVIKTHPRIDENFLRKVEEYQPDKVIIVDIAMVDQEFIDRAKVPVIWIDHHAPLKRDKVIYHNPRARDRSNNIPVSYLCYKITGKDLWISAVGAVGDWYMPDYIDELRLKHPGLAPKGMKRPQDLLFRSKLGLLARIFAFCLKGKTTDVMKHVRVLTRIDSPEEILKQTTSRGRYIYRRYEQINKDYQKLLGEALKTRKDRLLVFTYTSDRMSFTGELSNELIYRFPETVIIIAREKSGEMKCSLRSSGRVQIDGILKDALQEVEGYGGGHEYACGAVVKKDDFDRFISSIREQLTKENMHHEKKKSK